MALLPRSKCLWILWLQSPSAVTLEPPKIKSISISTFSSSIWFQSFECWVLSQFFHSPLSPSSRGSLVPFHLLPLEWHYLPIWGCWYFSWQSWFLLVSHPAYHFTWYTLHKSYIIRVTIYNLDVFLSQFLTIVKMSSSVVFWLAYGFLRRQVRWFGIPVTLRTFYSLL